MRFPSRSRWVLCVGLPVLCLGTACVGDEEIGVREDRIVGGSGTTIQEHPWQIALTTNSAFQFCGGSILNPSWVVTAQHCVAFDVAGSLAFGSTDMRVVAGITDITQQSSGQIRAIDAAATFPATFSGQVDPTLGGDVALLHLATPLDLSGANAKAIPLVTEADASAGATDPGVVSTITGWGLLDDGDIPDIPDIPAEILQAVDIPLISNADAQRAYNAVAPPVTITDDQIGAGIIGVGNVDSCQGDSGGPLTVLFDGVAKLGGLVSWGFGCADAAFPGMYARVSSFASYIGARANGVFSRPLALTGLSGTASSFSHRSITVPAGALAVSFLVAGGTGDADLYVRFGSQPTTTLFNCRPFLDGSFEVCTVDSPPAGTWFVSLRGFTAYSGASLIAALITP